MKCPECGGELKCWGECESGAMHYQCYKCSYEIHTIAEKWQARAEKAEAKIEDLEYRLLLNKEEIENLRGG